MVFKPDTLKEYCDRRPQMTTSKNVTNSNIGQKSVATEAGLHGMPRKANLPLPIQGVFMDMKDQLQKDKKGLNDLARTRTDDIFA